MTPDKEKPCDMPKDGYTYVEVSIPHKGMTLSGAMDNKSMDKLIDTVLTAEVDRNYVHSPRADQSPPLPDEVREAVRIAKMANDACKRMKAGGHHVDPFMLAPLETLIRAATQQQYQVLEYDRIRDKPEEFRTLEEMKFHRDYCAATQQTEVETVSRENLAALLCDYMDAKTAKYAIEVIDVNFPHGIKIVEG